MVFWVGFGLILVVSCRGGAGVELEELENEFHLIDLYRIPSP